MQASDFHYIRDFIYKYSAIVLEDGKEYLIEARLEPLAHREGFSSLTVLIEALQTSPFGALHQQAIDAMTTNETSFFRDLHPFESLRQVILPDILANRQADRTLNLWCAAASSGQEPYSIAMVLREYFPELANWKLNCVASDISKTILQRAKDGTYSQFEVNRGLPAPLLVKYFRQNGSMWQISDDLRQLWDFRLINLVEDWPPMPEMDLIVIRNVLIYFDVETKQAILEKIHRLMRPDGYLLLGGAETTMLLNSAFVRVQFGKTVCYQLLTS